MTQYLRGPARQQLITKACDLYAQNLTIEQVAGQIGYSKTATRHMLLAAGVQLRPKGHFPAANYPAGDPLTVACPKCDAHPGQRCQVDHGRPARRTHAARRRKAPET